MKYIIPLKENNSYTYVDTYVPDMLVDLLNIGKNHDMFNDTFEDCEEQVLDFVNKYGLLGFIRDLPINEYFFLDSIVVLKDFDATEYYKGYFGVYRDDTPVQTIRLKVWGKQRDYFKTLPLNDTMREVEVADEWSIFESEIAPTWEVERELLQHNDMVEVLEPACLRDMMIEHAWNMLHLYNEI